MSGIWQIDPLEAAIKALLDSPLNGMTSGRIASKHRYGNPWPPGAPAITLTLDNSDVHLYAPLETARIEMRCYGDGHESAMSLWKEALRIASQFERATVMTGSGLALVYAWVLDSGPSLMNDPDAQMDYVLSFWRVSIAELAVA